MRVRKQVDNAEISLLTGTQTVIQKSFRNIVTKTRN